MAKKAGQSSQSNTKSPATRRTKPEATGNRAVGDMNDALLQECNDLKSKWAEVERNDVMGRYDLAKHFAKICADEEGKKYGAGAVKKLADAMNLGKTTIHDYANVAKAWPTKRLFESVAKKMNAAKMPLSWCHFQLLASVEDEEQRQSLLHATLKNCWSVRELKAGGHGEKSGSKNESPKPQPHRSIALAAEHFCTQLTAMKANADTFATDLVEKVNDASPEDLTEGLLETLLRARQELDESYRTACEQFDSSMSRIKERLGDIQPDVGDANDVTEGNSN